MNKPMPPDVATPNTYDTLVDGLLRLIENEADYSCLKGVAKAISDLKYNRNFYTNAQERYKLEHDEYQNPYNQKQSGGAEISLLHKRQQTQPDIRSEAL